MKGRTGWGDDHLINVHKMKHVLCFPENWTKWRGSSYFWVNTTDKKYCIKVVLPVMKMNIGTNKQFVLCKVTHISLSVSTLGLFSFPSDPFGSNT